MARSRSNEVDRERRVIAQEAARIIVNHGVRDYRIAKQKAADRLGLGARGSLPGNGEVEAAVSEHLQIFGGESHIDQLRTLRITALSAMKLLAIFSPRLVGPALVGTADENSKINLHVFADSPESIATHLADSDISYRPYERKLKSRRDQLETYAGFEFHQDDVVVEATVFPIDGIRQAPMSPIDGRPMKRASSEAVQELLDQDKL